MRKKAEETEDSTKREQISIVVVIPKEQLLYTPECFSVLLQHEKRKGQLPTCF